MYCDDATIENQDGASIHGNKQGKMQLLCAKARGETREPDV
jgi:hypothetical protein